MWNLSHKRAGHLRRGERVPQREAARAQRSSRERHYLDVARGIPREARRLEAAMQIEAQLKKVTEAVKNRTPVTLDVKRNAS